MKRGSGEPPPIATHNATLSPKFDAEAEISALKIQVAELTKHVARLRCRAAYQDDEFASDAEPVDLRPKRGRKQRHSRNILSDRDTLVRLFEGNWPELEPLCGTELCIDALMSFLASIAIDSNRGQTGEVAQRLIDSGGAVQEFLSTPKFQKRFRGEPRVLAGALAGLPRVGPWRSLKLCPPRTCAVQLNDRAMPSYIRRKHPKLFRALEAGMDVVQTVAWLKDYRTRDKRIKRLKAIELHHMWKSGSPRLGTPLHTCTTSTLRDRHL